MSTVVGRQFDLVKPPIGRSVSASRIEGLMKERRDIFEKPDAKVVDRFVGEVRFEDVCFAYGEGENAVESVSLTVKPGEKIGILGRTGSGKSSLA